MLLRATARLPVLALLTAAGGLGVYAAASAGGALAGLLAAGAAACAVALVARGTPAAEDAQSAGRVLDAVLLAVPGLLTVYFSFNAGGYFPGEPALVAILLLVLLLLRTTLADAPFAGFSRPLAVAAGALSLLALWTLVSSAWSDAPALALLEFDRILVYLLALVLFGSMPRSPARLRWMVRGVALGIAAVAGIALATRFFPSTFPTAPNLGNEQLSYPLTYSNALGLLAALGAVLSLYLTTSLREPRAVRALAAAALPVLGTAVYLSLSRGAIFSAGIGLVAFVVLGRPRGLVTALVASGPLTFVAVYNAYNAEIVASRDFATAAGRAQGEDVAAALLLCAVGAALLRLLLTPSDRGLRRLSLPSHMRGAATGWAWTIGTVALVGVALAAGVPDRVYDYADRFFQGEAAEPGQTTRERLLAPETQGLTDQWDVALRGFGEQPLRGHGAGTSETWWNRERPAAQSSYDAANAHSLYLEVLQELGLVGFLLLATALGAILLAFAPVRRGRDRPVYAALFAAALAWCASSAVDWNWEMPAVTVWLFALAGAALARDESRASRRGRSQGVRVAVGLVLLAGTIGPGLVLASQRPLDRAVDAFYRGDCAEAIDKAAASISALAARPHAYEAIGWCQLRRGNHGIAVEAMQDAVEQDPGNWYLYYGLAHARGAAGLDPLPAARAARRRNPHDHLIDELSTVLRDNSGRALRRALAERGREQRMSLGR